jgi:hypothetical protein
MAKGAALITMGTVAVAALALAGCSDSTKQDFAACKLRAIETYDLTVSSTEHESDAAYYVQVCMEAAGYELNISTPACRDTASRWIAENCYHRKAWWERLAG